METEEKINILLVDDRPENLLALEAVLDKLDQNLVKASSGEEALNCLLNQDFAIILLDVQMPGMDGYEAAKLIRAREKTKNTPIIFLTAIHNSDEHLSLGYSLGAVDYIFKPINPEILMSKVKVFVELFRKTQELRYQLDAYKELESFTYSIAHDLRAPLRSINGFSGILLKKYNEKLDEEGENFLNIIYSQAKQMGQLIDDLLNFSKITQKNIDKTNIVMSEVAQFVIDELKKNEQNPNINITLNDLPTSYGDKAMIRQVLFNLLSNAFKYTRNKSKPFIEVGSYEHNKEIVYYVKDNGAGFDMKYAGRLFDVFQRLHGEGEFEGNGVGLAIVRRIIQKHGGRVFAEGKVDEGAKFCFTLPNTINNQV